MRCCTAPSRRAVAVPLEGADIIPLYQSIFGDVFTVGRMLSVPTRRFCEGAALNASLVSKPFGVNAGGDADGPWEYIGRLNLERGRFSKQST